MNSTLYRAFGAALLACGGTALSSAQVQPSPLVVYDPASCNDPTTPYSNPYSSLFVNTPLFGAGIGLLGTNNWVTPRCPAGPSVPGRIGFAIGPVGSIQDETNSTVNPFGSAARYDGLQDNSLRLTESEGTDTGFLYTLTGQGPAGIYTPAGGGQSFARVYVTTTTGTTTTTTSYLYGLGGLDSGFIPPAANGRYMVTTDTLAAGLTAQCVVEVLADAARVNWTLNNGLPATTTTTSMGLYFGQSVAIATTPTVQNPGIQPTYLGSPAGNDGLKEYITIPGRKPLTLQEKFTGANVPAYVNFSASQKSGWGLQILNSPAALNGFAANASADQTRVDEFTIGLPGTGGVINGGTGTVDPNQNDGIQSAGGLSASLNLFPVYLQKWLPIPVASGGLRTITSYYRATNYDSNYAPLLTGYVVTVDTPKAVSTTEDTSTGAATAFNPNPFRMRVYVDNTGSFGQTPDKFINMQNVAVTLTLPNGMHAVGDAAARVITKTITSQISPGNVASVDFDVAIDPTVSGAQTYTVSVTPRPGQFFTKTVTGTINVATTPRLLVRNGPNLVSPPWEYVTPTWSDVLSDTLNGGFQAYTWDAQLQKYVTQANPERRRGTWIVSTTDRGNIPLGGTPQTPGDQLPDPTDFRVGGAGLITLYPGWNLVGNPYTYAFPLGGLLGVLSGGRVLSYSELLAGSYTNGAFTYYDQDLKSYGPAIQGATARLQPNLGYWIYSNVQVDLVFPPLYDLFVRSAAPVNQPQRFNNWRLQLSAANTSLADSQNFVGIVRNPVDATTMSIRKAPISPAVKGGEKAIRAYVAGSGTAQMNQMLRASTGQQKFDYTVESRSAGPVTVSWPNLKELPSNLDVQVTDTVAGKTVNARSVAGYTYSAIDASSRKFQVTVTPLSTVAQRVNTLSTSLATMGSTKQMKIDYSVTGRGSATITVLKGAQVVATISDDVDIAVGSNSIYWAMVDGEGHLLPNGTYTLQVAATGEAGKTALRQATIAIKR